MDTGIFFGVKEGDFMVSNKKHKVGVVVRTPSRQLPVIVLDDPWEPGKDNQTEIIYELKNFWVKVEKVGDITNDRLLIEILFKDLMFIKSKLVILGEFYTQVGGVFTKI